MYNKRGLYRGNPNLFTERIEGQSRGKNISLLDMDTTTKAYIAGFLDGDGCIMFQLVYRHDYVYKYQVRASVVFYQKTNNRWILEWLQKQFTIGYIRDRNDDMTEYTIVGLRPVMETLDQLSPFLRLKKEHVKLARKIHALLPYRKHIHPKTLLKAAVLVDKYAQLNYSKKRKNTVVQVREALVAGGHIPCND